MHIVKHVDRSAMLQMIRSNTVSSLHLKECPECSLLYKLLHQYTVAGEETLPDAPAAWIRTAGAIARQQRISNVLQRIMANLSFDSWSTPLAVSVRSHGTLAERRLRFETEHVLVDLRAEKQTRGWDFVAQVTAAQNQPSAVTMYSGRTVVPSTDGILFQWTSKKPTSIIRIQVDSALIELPEISWKGPHKR